MLVPHLLVVAIATSEQGHQPHSYEQLVQLEQQVVVIIVISLSWEKSLRLIPFSLGIVLSQKYVRGKHHE